MTRKPITPFTATPGGGAPSSEWKAEAAGPANARTFMVMRRIMGDLEFELDNRRDVRQYPSMAAAQAGAAIKNAKAAPLPAVITRTGDSKLDAAMLGLKLFNGRGAYLSKPDLNTMRASGYVAAKSRADAARMICEYVGHEVRGLAGELREYWAEAWGRNMDGIPVERGIWIQQPHGKPVRVWPAEEASQ